MKDDLMKKVEQLVKRNKAISKSVAKQLIEKKKAENKK